MYNGASEMPKFLKIQEHTFKLQSVDYVSEVEKQVNTGLGTVFYTLRIVVNGYLIELKSDTREGLEENRLILLIDLGV